jgi:hypothetical protein
MPLRNVPITYTIDQQRQEINNLASDVNDIDVTFDEKVDDRIAALVQGGVGTAVTYDDANGSLSIDLAFNEFSTSSILEGTNLYYTDSRVNTAIDARVNQTFVNGLNITNLGPQDSITLTLGQTTKTLTPTNYNNTEWDTAYGWGDHSAQNYISTYSETDTLDSVTGRGGVTSHDVTVGSIKVNTITSKISSDNLGITAGKVLFTNDVSVGSFSNGLANDYGINFDKTGELIINHSSTGGGLYLKTSGTNNFYVDKDGKINGALKFVTADGTSGQSLQTDGNGQLVWGSGSGASVTVSDDAPGGASGGDLWWESDSGRLKVYYDNGVNPSSWVDASPPLAALIPATDVRTNTGAVTAATGNYFADTNGTFSASLDVTSLTKIKINIVLGHLTGTAVAEGYVILERDVSGTATQLCKVWTDGSPNSPMAFNFVDAHGQSTGVTVTYKLKLELDIAGSRTTGTVATSQLSIEESY